MSVQDDVGPMFVNIIGNPIDTDLSKLVRKRVPEMSKHRKLAGELSEPV